MNASAGLLQALAAAPDLTAAFKVFEAVMAGFGFISVDYAAGPVVRWPMRDNLDWRPTVVFASFDWSEVYFGTDFQKHDVMLPHMLKQTGPWLYWDRWSQPMPDPIAAELTRRAQERVKSGLSIPIHGPGLRFAGVNLGSPLEREAFEALDRVNRAEVFLLATQFHAHIQDRIGEPSPAAGLTTRERECLTWLARGKTAWESAAILGLSESSVKKHLSSAALRLGADSGAHAVAIALTSGMITP